MVQLFGGEGSVRFAKAAMEEKWSLTPGGSNKLVGWFQGDPPWKDERLPARSPLVPQRSKATRKVTALSWSPLAR